MTEKESKTVTETEVAPVVDGRKVTWSYERKVGLPNYSSEAMSIFITDHCPEHEPNVLVWASAATPNVVKAIKPLVWETLGLDYGYDANGNPGLIVPDTPVTPPPAPAPAPPPSGAPVPPGPPPVAPGRPPAAPTHRGDSNTMAQYGVYADWPEFCKECGGREFYDNRGDVDNAILAGRKAGPDWKCKNKACEKRYYRPGTFPYNEALKGGGPPASTATQPPGPPPAPHPHPAMHIPPDPTEPPPEG